MKVYYREAALADLAHISSYLQKRSPSGAINVLRAIRSAIDVIADAPLAARQSSDPAIRVKVVERYGYKIFYTPGADNRRNPAHPARSTSSLASRIARLIR